MTGHSGFSQVYSDAQKQVKRCSATPRRSNGSVTSQSSSASGKSSTELTAMKPQKASEASRLSTGG